MGKKVLKIDFLVLLHTSAFCADDLSHTSVQVTTVVNKNYLRQGEMLCFAVQTNEIRTCAML